MSLFPTLALVLGKVNFTNLSRYSDYSERTYRRQYSQAFHYPTLNRLIIDNAMATQGTKIASMDGSFVAKSGKSTYGLDWFYNGSAGRSEKGLEISVIAVIDVTTRQAYSLSVQQTPAQLSAQGVTCSPKQTAITPETIEQLQQQLQALPPKADPPARSSALPLEWDHLQAIEAQLQQLPHRVTPALKTRIDHYLEQLKATRPYLPAAVQYWVVDGFYSKQKFVDGVVELKLEVVSKLRTDANLRYLYEGPQKPRGAKRKYDGKVVLSDLSRLNLVKQLETGLELYTAVVWHVSLKRQIRLVVLVDRRKAGKIGYVLLFSTDINLDAQLILEYYQARFQIEFIFREAKQFIGLADCQARDAQKLDFHFNACLTTLNLARYDAQLRRNQAGSDASDRSFSMASYKRMAFNDHLLERFIDKLDLDPTLIKSHPNYQDLRSYGVLAS